MSHKNKIKKGIASKIAGSKTGRAVILQVLGEEGTNIVAALKSAVEKTSGHDKAKEIKELIFKFVLKAKIMGDEDQFKIEQTQAAAKPIMDLLHLILTALREEEDDEKHSGAKVEITELVDQFSIVHKLIRDMMSPHMQDKNAVLFDSLFEFLGGKAFVEELLSNAACKDEKHQLFANLNELMIFEDDPDSLLSHNVILSQSQFGDKYSSVISCAREFWHKVDKQTDEVGMNIFQALVDKHSEYYNQLGSCIYGDDPSKQHRELLSALNYAIKSLDDWPKLCDVLRKLGSSHDDWAPGMSVDAYDHMVAAIHDGFRESFGRQYSRRTQKSFDVVFQLMTGVLKDCYSSDEVKGDE